MARYAYSGGKVGSTHQVLLSLVPPTARRVLDVGCASGYLGRELADRLSCEVYGIDSDADSIDEARDKGYAGLELRDLNRPLDLPWKGPFDAVVAGDVLEHLTEPGPILAWIRDALAPGAPLIVSVPNVANAAIRVKLLGGRFDYSDTGILDRTHVHLYTYSSARDLLRSHGFSIEREWAGSSNFGAFLNGGFPGAARLRPLLANTVILLARVA
jgi:SAM-dependent methyltransferase